ncbi:uncharacterized protein [Aristolochia californica]|uniref:uncharacterized protein n=1 Tax=Aristolochia californica TaxID=171875 RepID=UPI0035DDF59D
MEVPIISRISDFEAGFSRLQIPSFVSRILGLSGIDEIAKLHTFWTWGALILAVLATFSSLIKRTKLLLYRLQMVNTVISQSLLQCDDDDDGESSCSSSCSEDSDSEEENEDEFLTPMAGKRGQDLTFEADFGVADSGRLSNENWQQTSYLRRVPRRLSGVSAEGGGENQFSTTVVKLWDGLSLGFKHSGGCGYTSTWDFNRMEKAQFFLASRSQIPALSAPCPAVLVSTGVDKTRRVAMNFWDARMDPLTPAVVAEWKPPQREVVGIEADEVEKVYDNDNVVRNFRNVRPPLTDPDGLTWFDADAVIVDGDGDSPSSYPVNVPESVVFRCRDAVRSYLF